MESDNRSELGFLRTEISIELSPFFDVRKLFNVSRVLLGKMPPRDHPELIVFSFWSLEPSHPSNKLIRVGLGIQ